jgi:hypothetical protein
MFDMVCSYDHSKVLQIYAVSFAAQLTENMIVIIYLIVASI